MARSHPSKAAPKRSSPSARPPVKKPRAAPAKKPAPKKQAQRPSAKAVKKRKPTLLEAFDQALRRAGFGRQQLHLLLQARRIGKLLAIQQNIPNQEFPPGVCFLHVNVPSTNSFCVRSLVEIDLEACTVLIAIHGDQELESGHVILPLEGLGWIGFPDKQVPVGIPFAGFHLPTSGKPLLVK